MLSNINKFGIVVVLSTFTTLLNAEVVVENMNFQNTYKAVNLIPGEASSDSVNYQQTLKSSETSVIYNWLKPRYSNTAPRIRRVGNVCELNAYVRMGSYVPQGAKVLTIPSGYIPVGGTGSRFDAIRKTDGDTLSLIQFSYSNGAVRNTAVTYGSSHAFTMHWTYLCTDDGRRP